MKKQSCLLCALLLAASAFAQTPDQIITRMEKEMGRHEKDGIVMTITVKVPVVGTMKTKTWTLGDKMRAEAELMGVKVITWTEGDTEWTYNSKNNELVIERFDGTAGTDQGGAEMFDGILDGYDVSVQKEDAKAWYITCKKSRKNKNKNAPKTMELTVAKGTYFPLGLSTKASGFTMTMTGISYGVKEKQVTFDINDYPDAKIVDKRK